MLIYNQGGSNRKGKQMFKITGIRKNGENINRQYDDENIAFFEYDLFLPIAKEIELYNNDELIKEFKIVESKVEGYLVECPSKTYKFTFENLAKQAFKDSFEQCNWTILYEIKNGEKKILDYYKKENKKIC